MIATASSEVAEGVRAAAGEAMQGALASSVLLLHREIERLRGEVAECRQAIAQQAGVILELLDREKAR